VRSPEYSEWITVAGWEVKRQIIGAAPIDCRFNCLIEVPISRRDTGNFEKATMDLCEHVGLLTNDGNAFEIVIRPRPRTDVMVALWCLPLMDGVRKQAKPRAARSWSRTKAKRAALTWLL
jgi:Holliday junction resolvase RusA-like endonuclease